MPREFGDRIGDLVSGFSRKVQTETAAKERAAEEDQKFLARFRLVSERIVFPILKGLENHSDSAVRFSASKEISSVGVQVSAKMKHNRIAFEALTDGQMVALTTNGKHAEVLELSQITEELVEDKVEERIRKLLAE
jgi:hypothetical protein